MTPTRRTLHTVGASALLAAVVLTGCAEEEPIESAPTTATDTTDDVEQSTAPDVEDDAEQTTAPDDTAATSAAPDEDAVTSEAPVGGEVVEASDGAFEVEIPDGWEQALDLARENVEEEQRDAIVVAVKEVERKDDFYTNVVITREEYVGSLTSAVEETAKQLAGEDGEYELLDAVDVDGNDAPGYTVVREVNGTTIHQTQRWVSHDGTLFSVTLSVVDSQVEDTEGMLEEMLSTWSWLD